ncbi:MAG: acyltransferase [Deltaproteobacteria bacterium]|nr:acyltransferase [Deltaproteobacteria bacterium]
MARTVLSGLIQASNPINDESRSVAEIQAAMLEKHLPMIHDAGKKGVQILCLQEIFNGPYFCPGQDRRWYDAAEAVPGPMTERFAAIARQYQMVIVLPIYEREQAGVYYNTAAIIDADGTYLGKYRKLNGAEIVFNPSATVAGLSQYLWKIEQPAHAVANGYFMGCINRVGTEAPWNIGRFYGNSYFVDPRGQILACGSEDQDELVIASLDLDMIEEVRRTWQFYRDRRPDAYGPLVEE